MVCETYELIVRNMLHQLGIGKTYRGYDYIFHAVGLICYDERFLSSVTKILYITIAQNYNTSGICVERNIRNVIHVIWENPKNKELISKFFGEAYVYAKPSNKEFLGLLYEYVKSYDLLKEIFHSKKTTCPFTEDVCSVYNEIIDTLMNIQ